ncbi:hypothetical protein [Streptomyces sp. NPDC055186]
MPPRDGLVIGYGTPPDHAFAAALDALCRLALPDPPQGDRWQVVPHEQPRVGLGPSAYVSTLWGSADL